MYMWPKEIQQIIAEVLHAKNPIFCLEKFKNYEPAKKITFLLFDGNQTTNFRHIIHDYSLSKYSITCCAKWCFRTCPYKHFIIYICIFFCTHTSMHLPLKIFGIIIYINKTG